MLDPESVAATMDRTGLWWAIAGGWAIDMWLEAQTRHHHDIEVVVRRRDQRQLHAALSNDWELFALDPPGSGWHLWDGTPIEAPAFQLQARTTEGEFDLFTETVDDSEWRFRRDDRIRRQADDIAIRTERGTPIVRPEIQLLYMAKSTEAKNQHDFEHARPYLSTEAADWLKDALQLTAPEHRWVQELG